MRSSLKLWSILTMLGLAILACGLPTDTPTPPAITDTGVPPGPTETASPTPEPGIITPSPTATTPPSLLRVAYVKAENVWLWTEGVGTVQLTVSGAVSDVCISDDGQVLAFIREAAPLQPEIRAINRDGSNERILVSAADFQALYAAVTPPSASGVGPFQFDWRPGTHVLYFNGLPLFEGPGLSLFDDLQTVDADTLVRSTLLNPGDGGRFYFSPDGNQLAITTSTTISLVNADGSNLRPDVLTFLPVITYSEYLYYPRPAWAPDSGSLRVAIPPADPMVTPLPPTRLFHIPIDGSPAVNLGTILAMPFAWPDTAFSPDLSRIAYVMRVGIPTDNMRELHLANADTSGDSVYFTGESVEFKHWLPNGNQFVFVQYGSVGVPGTHVGSVGGGYITLTTEPSQIRNITWVDASHYLYMWSNAGTWELRYGVLGGGSSLLDTSTIWSYDFSY